MSDKYNAYEARAAYKALKSRQRSEIATKGAFYLGGGVTPYDGTRVHNQQHNTVVISLRKWLSLGKRQLNMQ